MQLEAVRETEQTRELHLRASAKVLTLGNAQAPRGFQVELSPAAQERLSADERATLGAWAEGTEARRRKRAQIVLLSLSGMRADEVSKTLGVATPTVYKWLRRFSRKRLAGLSDLPRSGQPHRLPQEQRAEILRVTREERPPVGNRWTIRVAARHLGVTQHQIRQVWSDAGLRPHEPKGSPRQG